MRSISQGVCTIIVFILPNGLLGGLTTGRISREDVLTSVADIFRGL